jgi:hypothetical protein
MMPLLAFVGMLLIVAAIGLWYLSRRWQTLWKVIARIGSLALTLISVLLGSLFFFVGGLCGRYEFPAVTSPDGLSTASVSEEDCGATDSFHSSVQLSGRKGGPATVATIGHDPRLIELEWKGANELVVRYPNDSSRAREFRCQSTWEDVRIECVGYAPDYTKPVRKMPPVTRWWR